MAEELIEVVNEGDMWGEGNEQWREKFALLGYPSNWQTGEIRKLTPELFEHCKNFRDLKLSTTVTKDLRERDLYWQNQNRIWKREQDTARAQRERRVAIENLRQYGQKLEKDAVAKLEKRYKALIDRVLAGEDITGEKDYPALCQYMADNEKFYKTF